APWTAGKKRSPLETPPSPPSPCKPSSHNCGRLGIAHFFLESRTGWSKRHALTSAPQSDEAFPLARPEHAAAKSEHPTDSGRRGIPRHPRCRLISCDDAAASTTRLD